MNVEAESRSPTGVRLESGVENSGADPGLKDLEPAALLAAASKEAGLDDYGDEAFIEPLTQLMRSIIAEANLSAIGLLGTRARMVQCLVNRLRLQQDLKRYPEILDEDVSDPIVIVGLPRTGTTKLQRMLSNDPAVQRTPFWLLLNPAPLPGWKRGEPDARIALAQVQAEALAQQPDFLAAHPMAAEETEEDVFMMEMSFEGILPLTQYRVPSFHAWVRDRPRQAFYAYEKILLQYLQWQGGGRRGRPWVLKATTHLGDLQALIDTFPGVTLVHCHRDVSTSMASTIRAAEGFRGLMANDLDLVALGADYLRIYADEMSRYLPQRKRLESSSGIIDVRYDDIVHDPIAVIRGIYAVRERVLTPDGEAAMLGWQDENPQYRYGKISYSLERYGLTKTAVEQAFAGYRQRFAEWLGNQGGSNET
ncbi:MAG: hypothetical protein JWQ90_2488 [Hydrocarboniphaga sp.]|uniref:sulfotransferase family protein n=1 Tax=Hydrocarboniphaga sp. TaxID=2033016 RepID=UPI0026364DCE|nr:sulfotransferase [Hydrocarboniphaga sp.]MDB5970038.1 hypothetical protein [Hydrocarboniphaga sp.]